MCMFVLTSVLVVWSSNVVDLEKAGKEQAQLKKAKDIIGDFSPSKIAYKMDLCYVSIQSCVKQCRTHRQLRYCILKFAQCAAR